MILKQIQLLVIKNIFLRKHNCTQYAYPLKSGIGAIFMALWKGFRVGQARKKFGVSYPDMYSKDSKVR
jgi:hypothetical protein